MSKELLKKYVEDVNKLRKRAKDININDEEINDIFETCFKLLRDDISSNQPKAQHFLSILLKIFLSLIIALLICYVVLNVHQPTSSIVLRNVQGFIYPGFKLIRFLAVPIVKKFPSITIFYDESCLFENPYFFVTDMECWPCQNVYSVIDLTNFNNHTLYQSGTPYIVKTNQRKVKLENLQEIYKMHKEMFDRDASTIKSTNKSLQAIGALLDYIPSISESSDVHISWRINRMAPARIIRTLFPRPHIISEWSGQSIERYILLDEPNARPHALPNFECSYIFIIQGSGEQTIILRPSHECGHRCRTVSVLLKPSFVSCKKMNKMTRGRSQQNEPQHAATTLKEKWSKALQAAEDQNMAFLADALANLETHMSELQDSINGMMTVWYNWWYWRPISLPMRNATEISISYINSYC